jgi:hypothetical protein
MRKMTEDASAYPHGLAVLRDVRCWHLWIEATLPNGRTTKVPIQIDGRTRRRSNDDKGVGVYAEALQALQALTAAGGRWADVRCGLGFCVALSPVVALDFDACLDGGVVAPWASPLLEQAVVAGAYIETSPSGRGVRVVGIAPLAEAPMGKRTWKPGYMDVAGKTPAVEVFNGSLGYVTLTGDVMHNGDAGSADVSALVDDLVGRANTQGGRLGVRERHDAAAVLALPNLMPVEDMRRMLDALPCAEVVPCSDNEAAFRVYAWLAFLAGSQWREVRDDVRAWGLTYDGDDGWLDDTLGKIESEGVKVTQVLPIVAWLNGVAADQGVGDNTRTEAAAWALRIGATHRGIGALEDGLEREEDDGPPPDQGPPPGAREVAALGWCELRQGSGVVFVRRLPKGAAHPVEYLKVRDAEAVLAHLPRGSVPKVVGNGLREVSAPARYLAWPGKTTYREVGVWAPGAEPKGALNLWQGFAVEPQTVDGREEVAARAALMLKHLRDVICDGDDALYEWLLDWMADGVQRVGHKVRIAVVLMGEEGVGKGTFVDMLAAMYGRAFTVRATNPKHIVGAFNSILQDKVLLFGDEALFAGDRKIEGVLKGLVTEEEGIAERKGVDAVSARNVLRIVMATNNRHAIPVGPGARRYAVLTVSERYAAMKEGHHAYFAALREAIEDREAVGVLLAELLGRAVVRTRVDRAPQTQALVEQKELTLRGPHRWWEGVLQEGVLGLQERVRGDVGSGTVAWPRLVARGDLYGAYVRWAQANARSEYEVLPASVFMRDMRKVGAIWDDVRLRDGGERTRAVGLAPLHDARAAWARFLNADARHMAWGEEGERAVEAGGDNVVELVRESEM